MVDRVLSDRVFPSDVGNPSRQGQGWMIFNRPTNLWIGTISAILNAFVALGVFVLQVEQLATLNVALSSFVLLVANGNVNATDAKVDAATTRLDARDERDARNDR